MRHQPLKVANASAGIAKLKVVMSDDITALVPKNSLMTKTILLKLSMLTLIIKFRT